MRAPTDDDFNLYAYVGNDPLNRADTAGTNGCSLENCPPRTPPKESVANKPTLDAAEGLETASKGATAVEVGATVASLGKTSGDVAARAAEDAKSLGDAAGKVADKLDYAKAAVKAAEGDVEGVADVATDKLIDTAVSERLRFPILRLKQSV